MPAEVVPQAITITWQDIIGPYGALALMLVLGGIGGRWIHNLLKDQKEIVNRQISEFKKDLDDCEKKHNDMQAKHEVVIKDYEYLRGKVETIEGQKNFFGPLIVDISKSVTDSIGMMLDQRDKGK